MSPAGDPKRVAGEPPPGSLAFPGYRATPETVWRPPRDGFAPPHRMTERMHGAIRDIERADQDLARLSPARGGLLQRIRRTAIARNAFATASIEGNPLTLPEVESLLLGNPTPAATRDKDELEILHYAEFMASPAATRAPRAPADVLRVHEALFRGIFPDAGEWKTRPNFIGRSYDRSVVYVPTPPERVETELANALAWLHDARDVPPLLRALLFHHEFESIHPFRDGNGRTGRALTPMILHELGYEGIGLAQVDYGIYKRRAEYYEYLAVVERNGFRDYTAWLEYSLSVVRDAYAAAVETALFERALSPGLSERQRRIAEWFGHLRREEPTRRVKFNDVHHAFPEIPGRTLKRDLATLRDAQVLDAQGALKGTTYALRAPDA